MVEKDYAPSDFLLERSSRLNFCIQKPLREKSARLLSKAYDWLSIHAGIVAHAIIRLPMDEPILQEQPKKEFKKIRAVLGISVGIFLVIALSIYVSLFSAPAHSAPVQEFVVSQSATTASIIASLKSDGLIRSSAGMRIALSISGATARIAPGSYELSKSFNIWDTVRVLRGSPHEVWVVIPEGLRKEEIGAILASKLGWTAAQEDEWNTVDTNQNPDYFEGVYFPDTYLIPIGETPAHVAQRMLAHFQDKFAPYAAEALQQNIKWTTALKVASIVQREGRGAGDMPTIAGIIWNRLAKNMPLQIDATVQYARGNTPTGWWAPITHADESIASPYNTYLHSGLPPHPIDDPGIEAIKSALEPAATSCLYYLHDSSGVIHCSPTYAGQLANIATYLK